MMMSSEDLIYPSILTIVLLVCFVVYFLVKAWARSTYELWLKRSPSPLDVDGFVDSPPNYPYVVLTHMLSVGGSPPSDHSVKLSSYELPHVKGLLRTQNREPRKNGSVAHVAEGTKDVSLDPISTSTSKPPIVIGTIRMGFGHHRIAYAASSWALEADGSGDTYFHDLLNIDSPEADQIKDTDKLYSKMSRLTSNLGGILEKLWGQVTLSGNSDALRITGLLGKHVAPLLRGMPKDTPLIASHSLVALAAVACGYTNVINLVIDNHAQWFVVVPGCLNLVQGPKNYQDFLKMGIKPQNLMLAGHWIPRDLVLNIPLDCNRRIQRCKIGFDSATTTTAKTKPRRILIPVGGAGAQRKFIVEFVAALAPMVQSGQVQLFLNAGDHSHMIDAFSKVLANVGIYDYTTVSTIQGVHDFQKKLLDDPNAEPDKPITLFAFSEYFPAVATTDILSRVADILACKPSELAFYPVPKLMIRRVGDHEQFSALRAAELGDGTLEAREIDLALRYVKVFCESSELLTQMNQCIMSNAKEGVYDGCKKAVEIAIQRAGKKLN